MSGYIELRNKGHPNYYATVLDRIPKFKCSTQKYKIDEQVKDYDIFLVSAVCNLQFILTLYYKY